jgi:hypothetical protein
VMTGGPPRGPAGMMGGPQPNTMLSGMQTSAMYTQPGQGRMLCACFVVGKRSRSMDLSPFC